MDENLDGIGAPVLRKPCSSLPRGPSPTGELFITAASDASASHPSSFSSSRPRTILANSCVRSGICKPVQPSAATDRTLVMRLGQRFESARRLSVLCALAPRHRGGRASIYHL